MPDIDRIRVGGPPVDSRDDRIEKDKTELQDIVPKIKK